MSTKINKFNNEIIPLWNEVQNFVNGMNESYISDNYVENFAYLRKITAFLSESMSCIDADFLPINIIQDIEVYLNNINNFLVYTHNYTNSDYIEEIEKI